MDLVGWQMERQGWTTFDWTLDMEKVSKSICRLCNSMDFFQLSLGRLQSTIFRFLNKNRCEVLTLLILRSSQKKLINFFIILGNGWVSWKNDSFSEGYVELVFEFDQVRNFSAVYLHTNNFFSRNVQVTVLFQFNCRLSFIFRRPSIPINYSCNNLRRLRTNIITVPF